MKRFRFPLRPVAVLRAHRELKAREAFAAAVHAYVRSGEELAAIRARIVHFEATLSADRRSAFHAADEAVRLAAYRGECAAEGEAERAVLAARAAVERSRADYLEAHRYLEVVHRLETKARAAHRLATQREEQAGFDEFATRRTSPRLP